MKFLSQSRTILDFSLSSDETLLYSHENCVSLISSTLSSACSTYLVLASFVFTYEDHCQGCCDRNNIVNYKGEAKSSEVIVNIDSR